jgi:hypothetical protein
MTAARSDNSSSASLVQHYCNSGVGNTRYASERLFPEISWKAILAFDFTPVALSVLGYGLASSHFGCRTLI